MGTVKILKDAEAVAVAAAAYLTERIKTAVGSTGAAFVTLSGGRSPQRLYECLADDVGPWRSQIDWSRLYLLWSDERHVPPNHPESNFGMAERALLRHVPIPASQIHRIPSEQPDASGAARAYEHRLRTAFAAAGRCDTTCDVRLLGLGEDAHIASVFRDSSLLDSTPGAEIAAAVWAPHLNAWRITLTPAAIVDSRAILMIATGAAKAAAVQASLEGVADVRRFPAQLLRIVDDRVTWMIDQAAAALLCRGGRHA